MAENPVKVVTRITARSDKAAALRAVLMTLVEPSRREPGCLSYQLLQNAANPCDFVCVEEWKDSDAVATHLQTVHVKEAVAKATPYVAGSPEIASYSIVK